MEIIAVLFLYKGREIDSRRYFLSLLLSVVSDTFVLAERICTNFLPGTFVQ